MTDLRILSTAPRRLVLAAAALALLIPLTACRQLGRPVKKDPPAPEFVSPFAPIGHPGMTLPEIREVLQERRSRIRSARAALTLTIGSTRSQGRQQFDASVYCRPATAENPEVLRIRGSADVGPVFDFLLHRNEVQAIIYPDRKFYRGALADFHQNPEILAGVRPDELSEFFLVERTLYQRLRETPGAQLQESADHYIVSFQDQTGLSTHFRLRKADLLVDQVERAYGNQRVSTVRYFGYQYDETGGAVPTRFDMVMETTGVELSVRVGEVVFNGQAPANVTRMTVPDGYERMRL
mgnify:CR=1 FL=1